MIIEIRKQLKKNIDLFKGKSYHIELNENAKPIVHPTRKIPIPLRDNLKENLDALVKEKIIKKVEGSYLSIG